jgi:hypothetical protein
MRRPAGPSRRTRLQLRVKVRANEP